MPQASVPPVTLTDLQNFQAKHFSTTTTGSPFISQNQNQTQNHVAQQATHSNANLSAEAEANDDGEDDLGYYPDGVKRTLTDEQIRIFRHSEIHALLRERQLQKENEEYEKEYGNGSKAEAEAETIDDEPEYEPEPAALDDESLKDKTDASSAVPETPAGKKRSADDTPSASGGPAAKKHSKAKPMPDAGNVHLDYNEDSVATQPKPRPAAPPFMGRKIISYDD